MAEIWKYTEVQSRVGRYLRDFRRFLNLISAIDNIFTIDIAENFHKYTDIDRVLFFSFDISGIFQPYTMSKSRIMAEISATKLQICKAAKSDAADLSFKTI